MGNDYRLSAERVAAIRAKLGYGKQELSARIGGHNELVRDWERGRTPCKGPPALLLLILEALHDDKDTAAEALWP